VNRGPDIVLGRDVSVAFAVGIAAAGAAVIEESNEEEEEEEVVDGKRSLASETLQHP